MNFQIRPIADAELEAFSKCQAVSFGLDFRPEEVEPRRKVMELERSLAVFDGEQIVGTAGVFSYRMSVPGGELPTAGVTMVSVRPTHRRRGILTEMMRRQLDDVRDRGEPLAALWASESQIYGRFGYGLAAEGVDLRIERARAGFASPTALRGRTRQVDADEARESWPSIWEAVRQGQPGMMPRSDNWWSGRIFRDPESRRGGFTANVYVNYEVDGELHGYVRYRTKAGYELGLPAGTLSVEELLATTDDAYAALWQYVFGVDLVATIEAPWRKVDEPLYWMLSDPRRLVRHPHDSLWVRVVDVPGALEGRAYRAEGAVTFRVRDPFCAWVAGVYRLECGHGGASCRRVEATPDFELGAADLGACYLGGTRFAALARAGRVNGDASAIARADAMFAWDPLPWCPEIF